MIEGLRTDSLMVPGTELRASQWLAAISFFAAIGILAYNHFRGKSSQSVYGEDAEDAEAAESAEELAELDGISADDAAKESEDEIENDAENNTEDDIDAEDEESKEELAELDGASAEEVTNESEDDSNNTNERTEEE